MGGKVPGKLTSRTVRSLGSYYDLRLVCYCPWEKKKTIFDGVSIFFRNRHFVTNPAISQ